MDYSAEVAWAQIEALRVRVNALCRRTFPEECASIDQEFTDLREQVWTALRSNGGISSASAGKSRA
jgi:hypothetical protein